MDWFFRAFNKTGIYENCMKNTRATATLAFAAAVLWGWFFGRITEKLWCWKNAGMMYRDHPYIFPADEDE